MEIHFFWGVKSFL